MSKKDYSVPRILITGTGSGCGKTTVTCAILRAMKNRGLNVGAFKCGPDYIDPMFHSRIIGAASENLDPFFFSDNTLKYLLAKNGSKNDINVIEGVMGFYDGLSLDSTKASTYEVSEITGTSVILVVDARGASLSALAVLHGFRTFRPDDPINGVIFNNCTEMTYRALAQAVLNRFGDSIKPLGYMPKMPDCSLESRHLGLVTAQEVSGLTDKVQKLAQQAELSIDLEAILMMSKDTPRISFEPVTFPHFSTPVRIAAAMDKAFCFYYSENLIALQEMGAEIVTFSPLDDERLSEDIHGLYLGGGYPELYAKILSDNTSMRQSIKTALESGIPCIAECGGFMYLTRSIGEYPMVGFLEGNCYNTGKLARFGYISLTAKTDNMLCKTGEGIHAHEFHYWDCTDPGDSFSAQKPSGRKWDCVISNEHLYAGFPHFHFYANPDFAVRFYEACIRYKEGPHD